MSIYPARKKPIKAASGINTDQLAGGDQPIGGNLREGVKQGVGAIPVWGQLAQANMAIADGIRGDGSNQGKNVAAGFADPASVMLEGINKGKIGEVVPVYGQFAQAKRLKKESDKRKLDEQSVNITSMQEESNKAFGQLTYRGGGDLEDKRPDGSEPVQTHAVVLGGRTHKDGGNDVIDAESGEKTAETEREELMFTKDQTSKIEGHIAKYERTNDQYCLLDLGSLVKDIVENNLKDYSGKYS